MKPLFTKEEYEMVRYQDKLPCECYQCEKVFYKSKHEISRFIKRNEPVAKFCSKSCNSRYKNFNYKKQCPKCLKFFTAVNLTTHTSACGILNSRYKKRIYKEDIIKCHICDKEFNKYGIGGHIAMKHKGMAEYIQSFKKICSNASIKAKNEGRIHQMSEETRKKLQTAGKNRKHTEETKNKIRLNKIKFYQENPDKIPFNIYDYNQKSYPEKVFEKNLTGNTFYNFGNYEYGYDYNIYELDFAWIDLKLDVEIDGDFHLKPDRIIRDEKRNNFLIRNGWSVIRFEARLVNKQPLFCIKKLQHVFENLENYKSLTTKFWYKDFLETINCVQGGTQTHGGDIISSG